MTNKEKISLLLAVGGAATFWFAKRHFGVSGIGATRGKRKRFYVYAGYWENFISSEPMPYPYVLRRTFYDIDRALNYAESFGDNVVFCDNVKYDLPDYLYEALQDDEYEFFIPEDALSGIGKINSNRNGTRVIFRTFNSGFAKGEVIALFPDEKWDIGFRLCASYMHNGQHSGADYNGVIHDTRPAKPHEYAPLLRELQSIGYDDLIIAKRQ